MQNWIENIFQWYRKDTIGTRFASGAVGSFALKISYAVTNLVLGILLARWLGADNFGAYAYALSWMVVLSAPSGLGLDRLLVREVAALRVQSAWGQIRTLLRQANRLTLGASVGVAVIVVVVSLVFFTTENTQLVIALWIAMLLLPIMNLMRVRQAAMMGMNHAVAAQLPEQTIHPILFLVFVVASILFIGAQPNAAFALGLSVTAAVITLWIGSRMLYRLLPTASSNSVIADVSVWKRSVLPMVLLGALQVLNARIVTLILGAISGAHAVGIYAVASRGAEYVSFFLVTSLPMLSATAAGLFASKDMAQLEKIVTRTARFTLILSAPVAFALVFFGDWYLLLYGQDFTQGQTALAILSVGQLINVAMGAVGSLLILGGHERDAAKGIAIAVVVNIGLSFALIPAWGIEGAAIADASSLIVWNLLMAFWVYRRIGIHSSAFGKISFKGAE